MAGERILCALKLGEGLLDCASRTGELSETSQMRHWLMRRTNGCSCQGGHECRVHCALSGGGPDRDVRGLHPDGFARRTVHPLAHNRARPRSGSEQNPLAIN